MFNNVARGVQQDSQGPRAFKIPKDVIQVLHYNLVQFWMFGLGYFQMRSLIPHI